MSFKDKIKGYLAETKQLNAQYYIDETYATKEYAAVAETLAQRTKIVYEREMALKEKETVLRKREESIIRCEAKLHDQEQLLKRREAAATARENSLVKVATEKSRIAILDEKAALERSKTQAEDYLAALRKTEATIFNWLERMDDKDRKVYEEMAANNKKYVEHGKNIDGFAFEQQVATLLEQNNFTNIHVTSKSGDYGADITATKDEIKYVIQCKYYSSAVGIKAVQESYSAKDFYNAHVAVVATNNIFTKAATTLAEQLNVVLWDCEDLANMKKA